MVENTVKNLSIPEGGKVGAGGFDSSKPDWITPLNRYQQGLVALAAAVEEGVHGPL